jgi:hypothetical protein
MYAMSALPIPTPALLAKALEVFCEIASPKRPLVCRDFTCVVDFRDLQERFRFSYTSLYSWPHRRPMHP